MSHFSVETQQRPTMRRKSSAQNLLSSFKPSPNSSLPSPVAVAGPSTNLSFAAAGGATTPITNTSREYDSQSVYTDTLPGTSLGGPGSPQLPQGTSIEYLRDLVQKRIITLTYIRNIYEGRSHWFHTILISRADLDREFSNSNPDIKKRTNRFAILGMSLSNLLDVNQPQDLLRGVANTLSEYDSNKDDGSDKSKVRQSRRLFKPKLGRRGAGEYLASLADGSDTSYLLMPHMPFALDYHQTLLSLLDVISEVYSKISKALGPSPFANTQHMMGPLGLLPPHPGISYVFSSDNPLSPSSTAQHHSSYGGGAASEDMSSSLWNVVNAGVGRLPATVGPAVSWSASMSDTVLKIDGKFKKVTSTLLKELDVFARRGIRDELASLDPLLRNLNVEDGFDGL